MFELVRMSVLLRAAILATALLPAARFARAAPEEMVLVQRVIDTRYEQATQSYQSLLKSTLRRMHTVAPNETMQSITNSLYSIGPKSGPKSYQALQDSIVAWNNLKSPDNLRVGQRLLLPDLAPKKSFEELPGNPLYSQPKVSASPSLADVSSGKAFNYSYGAFTSLPEVTDVYRKAASFVIQWRWIPASQAEMELAATAADAPTLSIQSGRVTVQFADMPHAAGMEEIATDVAFVKSLLARKQPLHETVVYVLDDSWPTQTAFTAARDFFLTAEKTVSQRFALGGAEWPQTMLSATAQTNFPFTSRGVTAHAAQVDQSLTPLTSLTDKVKIVYVPLFSEQTWSKEFLHELLRLAFTARGKGDGLESGAEPAPDVITTARKLADQIAGNLPSTLVDDVAHTDHSVIASVLLFAQLYARATGVPFFVSMSWTVPKYRFAIGPEPDTFGVPLAAVGNNVGFDVMRNKVLLAMRAREYPGDVVAIMNAHFDGTVACSSKWVVPMNEIVYGFVYDGFPANGGCGTSFSTPRVAWLLALRQGFDLTVTETNQANWFINYRKFLLQLQDSAATGFQRYWLSPKRLFDAI